MKGDCKHASALAPVSPPQAQCPVTQLYHIMGAKVQFLEEVTGGAGEALGSHVLDAKIF